MYKNNGLSDFGLCTRKWGNSALVESLVHTVFFFQQQISVFIWELRFCLTIHPKIELLSNNCADSYTYLAEFQDSPGPLKAKWTTKPTLQSRKDDTHTHTYIAHQIREIVPRGGAKIINDFFFNLACQKGPCHLRIIFKARIYVFQGQISISFLCTG